VWKGSTFCPPRHPHLAFAVYAGASPWGKHADGIRSLEMPLEACPPPRSPSPPKQMSHGFLPKSQWKHFYLLWFLHFKLNSKIQDVDMWNHGMNLAVSSSLGSHWPFRKHRAHVRIWTAGSRLLPIRETWSWRRLYVNLSHHYLVYKLLIQMYIL